MMDETYKEFRKEWNKCQDSYRLKHWDDKLAFEKWFRLGYQAGKERLKL